MAGPRLYGATRKIAYLIWMKRHVLEAVTFDSVESAHDHAFSEVLKTYIHSETAAANLESVAKIQSCYVQFLMQSIMFFLKQEPIMHVTAVD